MESRTSSDSILAGQQQFAPSAEAAEREPLAPDAATRLSQRSGQLLSAAVPVALAVAQTLATAATRAWPHVRLAVASLAHALIGVVVRYGPPAARRLAFVPPFGVGSGLVASVGALVMKVPDPASAGWFWGTWATVLGSGVGLLLIARTALPLALAMPHQDAPDLPCPAEQPDPRGDW
ncbi:MAG TPA: hypothetical protein VFS20_09745 [Longimicrobium sp.]|nr:hypothetical protein [Longimicrobium sp.]